ncbi:MAG: RNA-directed DNA polymerase [Oligoflexia bacterium]|nr:RNA-directed DNA polymerase [Oligoflexia bacterium]
MTDVFSRIDFDLAWRRYKKDLLEQSFSDHPFELKLIESNLSDWLTRIKDKGGNYTPSRSEIVNVLKPGYHLRPGSRLNTEDGLVYQALLLDAVEVVRKNLAWSAGKYRFAYILSEDQSSQYWCVNEFQGWKNFRDASLNAINDGYAYVLHADIAAYFENISLGRLLSDLAAMGVQGDTLKILSQCLNRWAEPRTRGIPQGYRPSFLLGEVYLNSVDKRLHNEGINFARYVDDMRIFCKSKNEAVQALHLLTTLLREKELNLQSAKSSIFTAEDSKDEINGVTALIGNLEEQLKEQLREIAGVNFEYATPANIASIVEQQSEEIKLESLQIAFRENFAGEEKVKFNKSLFHYCLKRLGAVGDPFAVESCLQIAVEQPQELKSILEYYSCLEDLHSDLIEKVVALLERPGVGIDHQRYLLLRHIFIFQINSERAINFARQCSFDATLDDYTRDYARAVLGAFGDSADIDALEVQYNKEHREISKATLICSIARMDKSRRNAIYSRAENESDLIKRAVTASKVSTKQ